MTLTAELVEDGHLGSGAGGGGIDALVARDRRGRPVIWASHLEGVLRDAARRLRGDDVAEDFFGRGGGQQQRAVFTSLYAASACASRIWRSTARAAFDDRASKEDMLDNRAPKEDTLRVVEHVPRGTRFEGHVQLAAADRPLLRRLVQEVDALGRGRATGAGRVKLTLAKAPIAPREVGTATGRLALLLRNLDPVCITATATPDNLIPSLAFIPGRAVLGALAGWLIAEGCRDAATLLVDGRLSVGDALPLPPDGEPDDLGAADVLPAPLSLQSEKPEGAKGPVPWWARDPVPRRRVDGRTPDPDRPRLKRPEPDLFVYRSGPTEPWAAFRPQLRVRLRNGRPDPDQADPDLFAIEQIVEDTSFLCEIRGAPDDLARLAAGLEPVLDGRRWLRVGRAGAPVEVARCQWLRHPSAEGIQSGTILTLTSDLLVRDEYLRWCTTVEEALRHLPDWPAHVQLRPDVQTVEESVAVHGFNGTSRLWRMPAYGVRRGSVFAVAGAGVATLADRIARGQWLGERTHEGFGRFRLDQALPGVTGATAASQPATLRADDELEAVAETTCQWLKKHPELAEVGGSAKPRPSLSQWLDLVADLNREDPGALASRLNPDTAGKRTWRHPAAREVLNKLEAMQSADDRKSLAHLFVRRLRAELRVRKA